MTNNQYEEFLQHHGIKGMHWGIRRFQPYPKGHKGGKEIGEAAKTKKIKSQNISKWGWDKEHNILYVTGVSGSGKSTISRKIDKNAKVIHLDLYIEEHDKVKKGEVIDGENKDFSSYVNKKNPELIYNIRSSKSGVKRYSKEWINNVDQLMEYSEQFSRKQYPKNRVVMEGVQLMDETVYPDKNFFRDKPVIITTTNIPVSMYRASKRDGVSFKELLEDGREYVDRYSNMNKNLKKFKKDIYSTKRRK